MVLPLFRDSFDRYLSDSILSKTKPFVNPLYTFYISYLNDKALALNMSAYTMPVDGRTGFVLCGLSAAVPVGGVFPVGRAEQFSILWSLLWVSAFGAGRTGGNLAGIGEIVLGQFLSGVGGVCIVWLQRRLSWGTFWHGKGMQWRTESVFAGDGGPEFGK